MSVCNSHFVKLSFVRKLLSVYNTILLSQILLKTLRSNIALSFIVKNRDLCQQTFRILNNKKLITNSALLRQINKVFLEKFNFFDHLKIKKNA